MENYIMNMYGEKIQTPIIAEVWTEAFTHQNIDRHLSETPMLRKPIPEKEQITIGDYYKDCLRRLNALVEMRKECSLPIIYMERPFPAGNTSFRLGKYCSWLVSRGVVRVYVYPAELTQFANHK